MRLTIALLFFIYSINSLQAQVIKILDQETQEPIENAALYNTAKSTYVVSAADGTADISAFSKSETIIVTHVSHLTLKTTKAALIAKGNMLYLADSENELNEVVLSVSKFEQQAKGISQKIVSLDAEDVELKNPQTAADFLTQSGQVFVQKSQLGGGSPMIRGFSTNRLLLTVDGVRMNTAIFRSGNLQNVINIDPFTIDQTEIILGPGSVVYGSDAVGGVMNFYTKKPIFSFEDDTSVSGMALTRYATANNEKTEHVDVNLGFKKWAFLTSVSYSDFDDLRMGEHGPDDYLRPEYVVTQNGIDTVVENDDPNVQIPTGFDLVNLTQKVRFMPNNIWDFNLGLHYSTTSDYARYDRLTRKLGDQLRSAEWYYGPQLWFMGNLQIDKKGNGDFYDDAKLTVAIQYFEESRNDRDFGDPILFTTQEQVNAYSLDLDFTKKLNDNRLFYGVEYVYNKIGSYGKQTDINTGDQAATATRYPDDSSWQSLAAYLSGQFNLAESLTLQTGLRYNHILIDATFDDTFYDFPFEKADVSFGNFTGNAGLNWQTAENFNLKLNLGTAFRAPNIDDIGKIFDSEPGSVVVPNPDLKAEYAYNAELGAAWRIDEKLRLDVATYYTHLNNALVRRDFSLNGATTVDYQGEPSTVQAIQNAARAEVYGVEAGLEYLFTKNIKLTSQIAVTEGSQEEDDGSDAPLRHAAPLFGNTHLIYRMKRWKFDASAEYNGQFDYDELAPSQQGNAYLYALDADGNPYSPRWYTLNVYSEYQIAQNWKATAALENITDQRYRPYSSGISAPGRNLILALKYSF
ncbi:TonB-dependent receptor domain-containing protein [Leeuwenhoekiella polynyae]|uniref:Hemoglobin/transferrin/lactoferrin receptor protein n=1 Tax=Leeuwenhoekiella polynyae TaxID=1550906 RepID=A0A4Q0P9S5_9FLAO|nr:TonB-dependent receptor [Leeuwenhoekiella polynyae]RXG23006.1 hemoglobin/transferrin/lactoferrin receptor protein [Leeuwenhoekiella polynyae]